MTNTPSSPWSDMDWTAPPRHWEIEPNGVLFAKSGLRTDFWQKTFYGFERDDGHALLTQRKGDFTATLSVKGEYNELYDQAGLMIRLSPSAWIKFGIELTDGETHLSVVVTNGASDWSAQPIKLIDSVSLRATRLGSSVLLQYGSNELGWQMARLAPFMENEVGVGPYLCSPEREGFEARFRDFSITDPQVRELHE